MKFLSLLLLSYSVSASTIHRPKEARNSPSSKVLILGGGIAGVIAARTLHENGIDDFVIIEARDELGGRLKSVKFAGYTVEVGANWVQGTQTGSGPANPIYSLTQKHKTKAPLSDYSNITTYDQTGAVDYLDVFRASSEAYGNMTVLAGGRVLRELVDITSSSAYIMLGAKPRDPHAKAAEYFYFDWEYAQTPAQSSAIASSWAYNFTFALDQGGFSHTNLFSTDQRGFKTFIQEEAKEFLRPSQIRLNSTVGTVSYSSSGVNVILNDGTSISGDYALCTLSLGVLQNDDVKFKPTFPDYKTEAIATMTMGTYTAIFLKFPKKFWFDTELALYADPERGRYPIWQSLDHENYLPGSGILLVVVTGDYSEKVEALSEDQVKAEVLSVLHSMYPNTTIPPLLDFKFNRWLSDPLYRGSYSNWPSSFYKEHHDNIRANLGRLYFAGEATSQKYFGYMHGAYFEGQNVAKEMVQCIQHGQCATLPHVEEVKNPNPYGIDNVRD